MRACEVLPPQIETWGRLQSNELGIGNPSKRKGWSRWTKREHIFFYFNRTTDGRTFRISHHGPNHPTPCVCRQVKPTVH